MNDELLLAVVGELDPAIGTDKLQFTLRLDGGKLHLLVLGDPLVTAIIEAMNTPTTCRSGEGNTITCTYRELEKFELCDVCLPSTTLLLPSVSDDELRMGLQQLLHVPMLRFPMDVVDYLNTEASGRPMPASYLVGRYAELRSMVNRRILDVLDETPVRYAGPIGERIERAQRVLQEVHDLLFAETTLSRAIASEFGQPVSGFRDGNSFVMLKSLYGAGLEGQLQEYSPERIADLLQVIHAPSTLEEDAAAIIPTWVADILETGSPERVVHHMSGENDAVLDTAIRLYDPTDRKSLYSNPTNCIHAAKLLQS